MRAPVELALALGLLVATCRGLVVNSLDDLPALPATIGKTQLSPRAVYCDQNGFFTRLQAVNPDRTYTATLEVCCSEGSNARYEGDGGALHSRCLNLGAGSVSSDYLGGTLITEFPEPIDVLLSRGATNDGMVRTAGCGVDAISKIGYVDAAPPNELSDLPWEQLCSVGAACGLGSDLAVGCHDMDNDGAVIVASVPRPKHSCSDGEIVQAIYARWDGRAVQAIDGVSCRRIYARPEGYEALADPLQSCGNDSSWQDVRCQGTAGDYCGCLTIASAARDSFFGCVLSGSTSAAPLYTLPGVVKPKDLTKDKHCSVALIEESVGTGLWQTFKVAGLEAQCLEMDASSKAVSNADCSQDASVLPSQQFRLFSATPNARDPSATAIGALEPAVAPGICVFNTPANGILARCSCEALALGQCVIDGVGYTATEHFADLIGPYVAGYSTPSSDFSADAQNIAGILSTLAAGDGNLGSQLGAPASRGGDITKQLTENPQSWFDWAGIVRGGPSGVVQLLVQPFGGSTSAALAPELLTMPGLLGARVANAANMVGPLPAVSPESKIVALEVSNTRVTGTVPGSWGMLPDLRSLTLYATALDGPMPATFVGTAVTAILIEGNTGATFCGSGTAESPLSAALPACSAVTGIPQASYFVNAVLKNDVACETLVPAIQNGLVKETAHFVQITSVACTSYVEDVATPAARRMLRTSRSLLDASVPPTSQLVEVAYSGPQSSFDQLQAATATAAAQVEADDPNVTGLEASSDRPARTPRDEEPVVPVEEPPVDPGPGVPEPPPPNPPAVAPVDGGRDNAPSNPARDKAPEAASPPADGGGTNVGAIAGGIGAAVVIAVIACCLFWFCCWKKRKQGEKAGAKYDYELSSKPKETTSTMRLNVDARGHAQPPPHSTPLKDSAHRTPVKTGYRAERAHEMSPGPLAAGGVLGTLPVVLTDTPSGPPVEGAALAGDPVSGTSSMTRSGSTDSDKILPKIRVSGSSRSVTRVPAVPLPSSSNNYPLSAECSRLSSREIHRRMRSASLRSAGKTSNEASGETEDDRAKDAGGDARGAANPEASKRDRSVAAPAAATMAAGALVVAASEGYDEDSLSAPGLAVAPQYVAPAPYTGGEADAQANDPTNPQVVDSPRIGGLQRHDSFAASSVASGTIGDSGSLVSRGIRLRTTRRRPSSSRSIGGPDSPDAFTQRLGESFATSVIVNSRALSARSGSSLNGGASLSRVSFSRGGDSSSRMSSVDYGSQAVGMTQGMTQVFGMSQTVGASAWATASVLSDGTTVYTDIGGIEMDDAIASMEGLLNRCQTELEGQVGSYRLQGPRHRFAGRTSVVAFADGMWGGQFALKFYCEPDAAKREFAIYKKATELNMVLPPVQELEDNAGGVFRLKDGTPLPPHLAMPRGLPLPEWYAVHQPSQLAILECLAQSLHRLEQLHLSGYCHNDVKPANIILLESPNEREPRWHIVDFTAVAQSGDQVRARYTLEYASPELVHAVNSMRANYVTCQNSMDIWSMGVIMYEVITAEPFFPIDADRDAMRDGLVGLEPLPFEEDRRSLLRVPEEGGLRDTVLAMLSREPTMRPTAATVGRALRQCIRDLTGDSPERLDASPVSTIGGMDTSQEIR